MTTTTMASTTTTTTPIMLVGISYFSITVLSVVVFLLWRHYFVRSVPLGADASTMTQLISGRTKMGCHTAVGENRVSCSTIKPRGSNTRITPPTENFIIEHIDPAKGTFAIKSEARGKYCSDDNGKLQCIRDRIGEWETFTAERVSANEVAIKGYRINKTNGRYCTDDDININCNRTERKAWETFTASNPDAFFSAPAPTPTPVSPDLPQPQPSLTPPSAPVPSPRPAPAPAPRPAPAPAPLPSPAAPNDPPALTFRVAPPPPPVTESMSPAATAVVVGVVVVVATAGAFAFSYFRSKKQ